MQLRNKILAAALISSLPFVAHAESNFVSGATGSAVAHLDFQVVIPRFLYLQVGTGTAYTNVTTVNQLVFTVSASGVGTGTAAVTPTGGDISAGVVTAKVAGNNGDITFTSSTAGAMTDPAGDTLSWSTITTTAAANTTATTLAHPGPLADAGTPSVTLTSVGKVVNQDAKWTFAYANANIVAAGTYGGGGATNTGKGRVTYTATMP